MFGLHYSGYDIHLISMIGRQQARRCLNVNLKQADDQVIFDCVSRCDAGIPHAALDFFSRVLYMYCVERQ